jgi:hypothetical protein
MSGTFIVQWIYNSMKMSVKIEFREVSKKENYLSVVLPNEGLVSSVNSFYINRWLSLIDGLCNLVLPWFSTFSQAKCPFKAHHTATLKDRRKYPFENLSSDLPGHTPKIVLSPLVLSLKLHNMREERHMFWISGFGQCYQ